MQEKDKILREVSEREERLQKEREAKDKLQKQIQVIISHCYSNIRSGCLYHFYDKTLALVSFQQLFWQFLDRRVTYVALYHNISNLRLPLLT